MIERTGRGSEAGFSLLELMVAMVLGLILIAGAVSVYTASSRTYSEVEQVAVLTENGRFGLQLITDSLRHTGFFGRVSAGGVGLDDGLGIVNGDCVGPGAAYRVSNYLVAVRADGAGVVPGCVADAVPDSDVLIIKHAIPRIRDDIDCGGGAGDGGVAQSGTFLMTNNIRGLLFECQDGGPTTTIGGDIPGGVLWEYEVEVYYVRDADTPVLTRKTLIWNGAAMELRGEDMVDGVEFLHLLFGFDGTGDGEIDSYAAVDGMAPADWDAVESVEIRLLLRSGSPDGTYRNNKTYLLPGRPDYVPNDNFRRLLLTTRVSLRNPQFVLRGNA